MSLGRWTLMIIKHSDTAPVEAMHGAKDDFDAFVRRRMRAALGQQSLVVNLWKL